MDIASEAYRFEYDAGMRRFRSEEDAHAIAVRCVDAAESGYDPERGTMSAFLGPPIRWYIVDRIRVRGRAARNAAKEIADEALPDLSSDPFGLIAARDQISAMMATWTNDGPSDHRRGSDGSHPASRRSARPDETA